jgi:hypothetical protein
MPPKSISFSDNPITWPLRKMDWIERNKKFQIKSFIAFNYTLSQFSERDVVYIWNSTMENFRAENRKFQSDIQSASPRLLIELHATYVQGSFTATIATLFIPVFIRLGKTTAKIFFLHIFFSFCFFEKACVRYTK